MSTKVISKEASTLLEVSSRLNEEATAMIKRRIKKAKNAKYRSVWDALEAARKERENMKVRSVLMRAIHGKIVKDKVSQAHAAVLLKVSQPRVSDLMRGKIDLFSTDALINIAALLGLQVHVKVKAAT